jgi:Ca-activated chloride channel family protein
MRRLVPLLVLVALVAALALPNLWQRFGPSPVSLHIVSGSENRALEPIVADWGARNGVDVQMSYLGSVDIARALEQGAQMPFDAVWPAHSLWIELGDTQNVVAHETSILRSPVVLGLKRSIAEDLGWIGRTDITVEDIAAAATADRFRLAMTSATQSNSGASAYLGFVYALSGNPDVLTLDVLADPDLRERVRDLLAQVDRSSGSSGWLKDTLVAKPGAFDAMMNYEALIIEASQALVAAGEEPLYAIYPATGIAVADSPLGLIDRGDPAREAAFLDLQAYLLGPEVQARLASLGRRAGPIGLMADGADGAVWNPDWGIDPTRAIVPVPTPAAEVIREALTLYQTELRKPSLTIWVLDVSGSMAGTPLAELKRAMTLLLDPEAAAVSLLQPSSRDVTVIVPFNHDIAASTRVVGNDPAELARALSGVNRLQAQGGTDLYRALAGALEELEAYSRDGTLFDYLPAIVAMTDGASDDINRDAFLAMLAASGFGRDVPIHAIAFGEADEAQLEELNAATLGRLFHAGDDLGAALRQAKGYN